MKKSNLKILAIESSCDETAAAVIEKKRSRNKFGTTDIHPVVLSNIINSQIDIHKAFGGVFPEVASKAHAENIIPVIESALGEFNIKKDIDIVAVTIGPGLIGSLLVGVNAAKTLAFTHNKPIMPINHWLGHIYSCFAENSNDETRISNELSNDSINSNIQELKIDSKFKIQNSPTFPLLALIVSGGHTGLVIMKSHTEHETIGQTLDDAAGEAFDKVAKLLELGYPGGPAIGKAAERYKIQDTNPKQIPNIKFPRAMLDRKDTFDFSFSGIKTSVLNKVRELALSFPLSAFRNQIAYEFQQCVIDILIVRTLQATEKYQPKSICLCGGVSANKELREQLAAAILSFQTGGPQDPESRFPMSSTTRLENDNTISFHVPPLSLTGDNAAMIGIAAAYQLTNGVKPTTFDHINANSNLKL